MSEETKSAEPKKGFFSRLKERLSRTKEGVVTKVKNLVLLRGRVDEELLEEIEAILIQADLGVETTLKIIESIRQSTTARPRVSPTRAPGRRRARVRNQPTARAR